MEYWFPGFPENTITLEYSALAMPTAKNYYPALFPRFHKTELGDFEKTIQ